MKKTSLVGHILEVLELIESQPRPADGVLADFFRSRHYLGSKDRRFISEIVYGILRNYLLLQNIVAAARGETSRHTVAPTPLEFYVTYARAILKEESSAIIADISSFCANDTGEASFARFLEAIDQIRLPDASTDPPRRLSILHSIPERVVREWVERFGEEETENLCKASNLQAPVTIRVNTLRCTVEECDSQLKADGINTVRTRFSPVGLTLEKRVNVQSLRAFREGAFEMQDEGSQVLSFLLEPSPGSRVVDACAGAGGKTLHIAALMKNKGSILAIDTEQRRLNALRDRAERAGASIIESHRAGDIQVFRWDQAADAVLIDAPCTGTGTFRRNPGTKREFAEDSLSAVSGLQLSILKEYSRLVKPGGRLVYATCSLLREENEDVVDRFLHEYPAFHILPATEILARQGISLPSPKDSSFLNLLPHLTNTDGFFGAVMEREGG